jgi:hypothetical protein
VRLRRAGGGIGIIADVGLRQDVAGWAVQGLTLHSRCRRRSNRARKIGRHAHDPSKAWARSVARRPCRLETAADDDCHRAQSPC